MKIKVLPFLHLWTTVICCWKRAWLSNLSIFRNMSGQSFWPFQRSFIPLLNVSNRTWESIYLPLLYTCTTTVVQILTGGDLTALSATTCLYICLSWCLSFQEWRNISVVDSKFWALAKGQLYLALDFALSVFDNRTHGGHVMDSTHSQTLVVLCGQRLTSGRCLFMTAVNTGSGRI